MTSLCRWLPVLVLLLTLGACGSSHEPLGDPYLEEPICDLGEVPHGKLVLARFVLCNPTGKPLLIRQVVVSCACAYLNLTAVDGEGNRRDALKGPRGDIKERLVLNPGEKGVAVFRYVTAERDPIDVQLQEDVRFLLDHPRIKLIKGAIKIKIRTRFAYRPQVPNFETFSVSQTGQALLKLWPHPGGKPFRITGFHGLTDKFKARIVVEEPDRTVLRLTAGPGLEPGPYMLPLIIQTDLDGGYDFPINFRARVVPDLHLSPGPLLPLGLVRVGRERQVTSTLRWRRPGPGLSPRVESCRGGPGCTATLEVLKPGRYWRLRVTCRPAAGSPPGPFQGEVILHTGMPDMPTLKVPFRGSIQP